MEKETVFASAENIEKYNRGEKVYASVVKLDMVRKDFPIDVPKSDIERNVPGGHYLIRIQKEEQQ